MVLVSTIDAGAAGAGFTVNDPAADHDVTAAVVGEESPWAERTRQNFCPAVRESTVRLGLLSCGESSSICWKPESFAICNSYPLGWGLATSVQASCTGSVSEAPLAGESGAGGAPMGLL